MPAVNDRKSIAWYVRSGDQNMPNRKRSGCATTKTNLHFHHARIIRSILFFLSFCIYLYIHISIFAWKRKTKLFIFILLNIHVSIYTMYTYILLSKLINFSILLFFIFYSIYLSMYTPSNQHFKAFPLSKISSETSFFINFSTRIQIS